MSPRLLERGTGLAAFALLIAAPLFVSTFFLDSILSLGLITGITAASLIFLSAYAGMVSLAQTMLYGVSAFALGNLVVTPDSGSKGLKLGVDPYLSVVLAVAIATAVGLLLGAVASRSTGIYFLMLTLVYSVIGFYFFGQVVELSGFGGINNFRAPSWLGDPVDETRLYYLALAVAALVYLLLRYVARTPFGLALQGIRDDPVRMASLGYLVPLHRTLAFGFAGFIASLAGVLGAWWTDLIAPGSIGLGNTLDLLVIAVIGGLLRIEGAWIGAFAFAVMQNYLPSIDQLGDQWHTAVGLLFLAIVLLSPDGAIGLWGRLVGKLGRSTAVTRKASEAVP